MGPLGELGEVRRILIYGVTGSGKTTMARRLSALTGLPWHSVDDLTWEPGWVQVPEAEQRRRVADICREPEWILDTAYEAWLDEALSRAELIVGLDYPRWFSLQRLLRRTAARLLDRRLVCNRNRETLRQVVGADSIVVWHFRSFRRKRSRMISWEADPKAPAVVRLRSARQTEHWLRSVGGCDRAKPDLPL